MNIATMIARTANDTQPYEQIRYPQRMLLNGAANCENAFDLGQSDKCICGQHQLKHALDSNGQPQSYLA